MNLNQFKEIIVSQKDSFLQLSSLMDREVLKNLDFKDIPHIVIIKGLRRCGKSVLLSKINHLIYEKEYSYINFDDERLLSFTVEEFSKLYESFLSLDANQKTLFFDEIQEVDQWERAIRRLYDKKIKFYITGSNASLLSKELGTKLTGRYIQIELFPFSFSEFLQFKSISFTQNDVLVSEKKVKIQNYFDEYFKNGGMPEFITYGKKELIQQVYEDILLKDIVVRYNLSADKSLRQLAKYLLSNIGKPYSYNSLAKNLGFGSLNTVKSYIHYLENSYLLFEVEKYEYSLKKQIQQDKKVYAVDLAFINLISFEFSSNKGRKLENLVFLQLKRQGKEIYYHKAKHECDFVIKQGLKINKAIQVCYELTDENKKREITGLVEACKTHKLKKGLLLTYDYEDSFQKDGIKIEVKPVWKWLIE